MSGCRDCTPSADDRVDVSIGDNEKDGVRCDVTLQLVSNPVFIMLKSFRFCCKSPCSC